MIVPDSIIGTIRWRQKRFTCDTWSYFTPFIYTSSSFTVVARMLTVRYLVWKFRQFNIWGNDDGPFAPSEVMTCLRWELFKRNKMGVQVSKLLYSGLEICGNLIVLVSNPHLDDQAYLSSQYVWTPRNRQTLCRTPHITMHQQFNSDMPYATLDRDHKCFMGKKKRQA